MAKNKDEPTLLTAEELLEARVDAMMDPRTNKDVVSSAPTLPGTKSKTTLKSVVVEVVAPTEIPIATATPVPTRAPSTPEVINVGAGNLDTPTSDAAIDDIVAQEADEVLAAEDAGIAAQQATAEPVSQPKKRGHPVFWFIILLLATLAIIAGVLLTNPNLQLPFQA